MGGIKQIIEEVACTLAANVKAYNIPAVTANLGLSAGEQQEAFASKRSYVMKRLAGWSKEQLVKLAKAVQETYPTDSLQSIIEEFDPDQPFRISSITRQHLFCTLSTLSPVAGKLSVVDFMEKLWPIRTMRGSGVDFRCMTAYDEIDQHMIQNDDYTFPQLLEFLGLQGMSNK